MNRQNGVRGYISSRAFMGNRVPQAVQNLVIRDYCERQGLRYLLSATEYAMPNSYMMLEQVINGLSDVSGIVAYSLFQLPTEPGPREKLYQAIFDHKSVMHFALESLAVADPGQIGRIEDIWAVRMTLPNCLTVESDLFTKKVVT